MKQAFVSKFISGFTFIELLVYSGLFSLLFLGVTETWLGVARGNAAFTRLAEAQEAALFAAETLNATVAAEPNYAAAQAAIAGQTWHTISSPWLSVDSTGSPQTINHLTVSFLPLVSSSTASSSWQLDYYYAQ